jgi:HEAT repeat protein
MSTRKTRSVSKWVKKLNSKDQFIRIEALENLAEIGNEENFLDVIRLLNDEEELVRVEAIETLYWLAGTRALEYLLNKLHDKSKLVRSYTGTFIGFIGDKSAIRHLAIALKRERSTVAKVGLLDGLFRLGQEERLYELIPLLKHRIYRVRCSIAYTLERLPIKEHNKAFVIDSLKSALDIENTVAAREALNSALQSLSNKRETV